MQDKYYELEVIPSSNIELFCDFILTLFPEAIEETENSLIVRSEESLELIEWGVKEFAQKLSSSLKKEIYVKTVLIEKNSEDWVKKYQDSIEPVVAGNIYIHPSWIEKKDNMVDVIINPALAFGSGHHESTYGCLLMLQRYVKIGSEVLDVGTGSGILAISAIKLGAICDVCDTDEQATQSANENSKINSVKFRRSWVGSVLQRDGAKYDIVVANIIADVLTVISKDLIDALKEGGILVLSGILNKYSSKVKEKYSSLTLIDEMQNDEWSTLVYER